jgi:hypothetical protein
MLMVDPRESILRAQWRDSHAPQVRFWVDNSRFFTALLFVLTEAISMANETEREVMTAGLQ